MGESMHLSVYSLESLVLLLSQYFKLRLGNDYGTNIPGMDKQSREIEEKDVKQGKL